MKKEIIITGLVLILGFAGCKKNDDSVKNSGEATINSELILEGDTYTFNGFSFKLGKVISYNPQTSKTAPDLILRKDDSGPEIIAYLEIWNNSPQKQLFGFLGGFNDLSSAEDSFNNYKQVSDSLSFHVWAKPILENQVWIIKTLDDHYAKILTLNVKTPVDSFAETTFKWVYQPDGSNEFDN